MRRWPEPTEEQMRLLEYVDEELLALWTSDNDRDALMDIEEAMLRAERDGVELFEYQHALRGDFWHEMDPWPAVGDIIYKCRTTSWSTNPSVALHFAEFWLDDYYDILDSFERDKENGEDDAYLDATYGLDKDNGQYCFCGRPYVLEVQDGLFTDITWCSAYSNERELLSHPATSWKIVTMDTSDLVMRFQVEPLYHR